MVHGDHWDAIFDDEEAVLAILPELLEKGRLVGPGGRKIPSYPGKPMEGPFAVAWPDTPLRYMAHCVPDPEAPGPNAALFDRGFPFCAEGAELDLTIQSLKAEEGSLEGCVTAYSAGARHILWFYDPLFFLSRSAYVVGRSYRFNVAGLAISLHEAQESAVEITEGPLVELRRQHMLEEDPSADVESIQSATVYIPAEASLLFPIPDMPHWSSYRGPVERVDRFTVNDVPFVRLWTKVVAGADRALTIPIYAAVDRLEGYDPAVGDSIDGVAWLQGYAVDG